MGQQQNRQCQKGPLQNGLRHKVVYPSKVEAILLSAFWTSSHSPFFMLNVKQGICEEQLLESYGLTQPENRTQVYRPQNHVELDY